MIGLLWAYLERFDRHLVDVHTGSYSYQRGPIPPGPLTAEQLSQTDDD